MISKDPHDRSTIEYASPHTEPVAPAGQIVLEILAGVVLLVLAVIFFLGAIFYIRSLSLLWAVLYLAVAVVFACGGGVEIQRGIRHQRRP